MTSATGASRRRAVLFAAISLLLAGGTAALMHRVIQGYEARIAEAHKVGEAVQVVAAARDVPAGEALTAEDLQLVDVLARTIPTGKTYADVADLIGDVPRTALLAGEVIRQERFEGAAPGSVLTGAITEGWRAVTVRVDKARGVGGLLSPGDRVDVIVTIRPDDNSLGANWVTETILQDARVLARGDTVVGAPPPVIEEEGDEAAKPEGNGTSARWEMVTLELLPEEAEKVALATTRGELHLTLRRSGDTELMESTGPTVTNALLGLSTGQPIRQPTRRRVRVSPPPPPKPDVDSVEVIQGDKTTVDRYDEKGQRITDKKGR